MADDGAVPVSAASVARFARLLADETRAAMCLALLDGRAWTAGELAAHAGVAPSTATAHLDALVAAELLAEVRQGRHRYVRLADPEVAATLERLGAVAGERPRPSSLRTVRAHERLRAARTCYDHLAGALGVALLDGLEARGLLATARGVAWTSEGERWLASLVPGSTGREREPRTCLDWTERRDHLGGRAGAALLAHALDAGWLAPVPGVRRALRLTAAGREGYGALGVAVPAGA